MFDCHIDPYELTDFCNEHDYILLMLGGDDFLEKCGLIQKRREIISDDIEHMLKEEVA